ncbi:MAG: CorA family divalent cation transporter [Thermoguttaceae bacterium]|jgi:Mg2+ and Co2+ transporter CorA
MPSRSPLPELWKIPPVFRQRIRESIGRQRVMQADGHVLLVLHAPPKANEHERAARFFWRSPDGSWQSTSGAGIGALQKHLAEYDGMLQKLDQMQDDAEWAKDFLEILQQIAPLRRSTRNLYETLQEAREIVSEDNDLILCRDQAYALQRRAELIESDTRSGLECAVVRRAEEQAESSQQMAVAAHRLNLLAALFFPIATIAAVFGMNLRHGLEGTVYDPWLFWLIVSGGLALGVFFKGAVCVPSRPSKSRAGNDEFASLRKLDRA